MPEVEEEDDVKHVLTWQIAAPAVLPEEDTLRPGVNVETLPELTQVEGLPVSTMSCVT